MAKINPVLRYVSPSRALEPGYEIRFYGNGRLFLAGRGPDRNSNYLKGKILRKEVLAPNQVDEYAEQLIKGGILDLKDYYRFLFVNASGGGIEELSFNYQGTSKTIVNANDLTKVSRKKGVREVLDKLKRKLGVPEDESYDNLLDLISIKPGQKA